MSGNLSLSVLPNALKNQEKPLQYKAPLEDMFFLLQRVFKLEKSLAEIPQYQDFDENLYQAVLQEAAKFCEEVLFPINRNGDEQGCNFSQGKVTTPDGFKQAYEAFCEAGWSASSGDPKYGGQGLPKSLHVLFEEMIYSSNTSFCLYSSLTNGAYHAIHAHASEKLKRAYLPPMLEGRWSGAMGLTEPHAGSDLGIIKTKAIDNGDGSYTISGTKIFITGGEHDLTENIIHLVLARLPDAPQGVKGISLFLVPKIKVNKDGSLAEANGVSCGSIEHKMGIKASATCVINFDDAQGYLVGEKNKGLFAMFTMMNLERLSIGIQGIGLAETSYQLSRAYATDRKQGKNGQGETANIIEHADVRRMLLMQRAYTEPARALAVFMGLQVDKQYYHPDRSARSRAKALMALLTPIAKAFFTDKGYDSCNYGLQILGGHGYVREWGLEQLVRDAKIAQIYEGTNGIQAQDLLVRKVCLDKKQLLSKLYQLIEEELAVECTQTEAVELHKKLHQALLSFRKTSDWLVASFSERSYEIQGVAVDYLNAAGHLVYAWLWLKMLNNLHDMPDECFVQRKKLAGSFYTEHLLPQMFESCRRVELSYSQVALAKEHLI